MAFLLPRASLKEISKVSVLVVTLPGFFLSAFLDVQSCVSFDSDLQGYRFGDCTRDRVHEWTYENAGVKPLR